MRHGFKFYGEALRLAYFRPAHGLNPEILAQYEQNRLVVTRQVKFNPHGDESIDLLLSLNGLPIATEEGFILDVLQNYTTYKTYYRLVKAVEDDPQVDKRQATRTLARFMSLHPHNIAQKTQVMVEHFQHNVHHRIQGQAKAMVVTSSRLHAVKYKQAFDAYLTEHGYSDITTLVAFSGTVVDEAGLKHTEPRKALHLRALLAPDTPQAGRDRRTAP
jgi:type I site-specific restriction-modification system R (restriction) subunit